MLECGIRGPCLRRSSVDDQSRLSWRKIGTWKNCLFIERDALNIVDNVRRLLAEPDLRLSLAVNGRQFAEQYHDVKVIAGQYDEVFQNILERRKE